MPVSSGRLSRSLQPDFSITRVSTLRQTFRPARADRRLAGIAAFGVQQREAELGRILLGCLRQLIDVLLDRP